MYCISVHLNLRRAMGSSRVGSVSAVLELQWQRRHFTTPRFRLRAEALFFAFLPQWRTALGFRASWPPNVQIRVKRHRGRRSLIHGELGNGFVNVEWDGRWSFGVDVSRPPSLFRLTHAQNSPDPPLELFVVSNSTSSIFEKVKVRKNPTNTATMMNIVNAYPICHCNIVRMMW